METTTIAANFISPEELLKHWQGHRSLTRRVIEAFPEKELFEFSIGGMRPFSKLVAELLAIGAPGLKEIVTKESQPFDENRDKAGTKLALLNEWDNQTEVINDFFVQIPAERFHETHKLFGQYESPVKDSILYFIDNEIHHRGQGYVYLRALGIEPPPFWER